MQEFRNSYTAFLDYLRGNLQPSEDYILSVRVSEGHQEASGDFRDCQRIYEVRKGQYLEAKCSILGVSYDNFREKEEDIQESTESFFTDLSYGRHLEVLHKGNGFKIERKK